MSFNPEQDAQFESLARTLVNLKKKPVAKKVRNALLDGDGYLFDGPEHTSEEYEDEFFLRDFLTVPDFNARREAAWLMEPRDMGAGVAQLVDSRATAGTFTRATTATTVDGTGKIVSVGSGVPRFMYDPTTLAPLGFLSEGARTNLCLQSEDLATTWTSPDTSVSANATIAPDGASTADKIVEDATTAFHFVDQAGIAFVSGTSYTFSAWLKAAERTTARLQFSTTSFPSGATADFNLSAGTATGLGGGATAMSITAYPNGWYRCSVTAQADATLSGEVDIVLQGASYAGDGTSGLYAWGTQIEAGAFPSSYIPTTTGAVARNADVLTFPAAPWFNGATGTLYARFTPLFSANAAGIVAVSDGTNNNKYELVQVADKSFQFQVMNGGASQAAVSTAGTFTDRTAAKLAVAYAANDFAACRDGGTVATDTAGSLPTVTTCVIGANGASQFQVGGTIGQIAYWRERLPNATLQAITANGI